MKKKIVSGLLILASTLMMAGCGSSSSKYEAAVNGAYQGATSDSYYYDESYYSDDYYYEDYEYEDYYDVDGNYIGSSSVGTNTNKDVSVDVTDRKLIRNVNLSVETKEYDALMDTLYTQISNYGGYIENEYSWNGSTYNSSRDTKYSNLTIRVPKQNLDSFLASFTPICNVTSKTESVDDVTLTYVDLASHKEALLTEQERLLELLEMAESLDEVLIIEDRLASVRYQIESMESQLRTFDNQVDYSTVYLKIEEVQELTIVEPVVLTRGEKLAQGFAKSMESVRDGFLDFGVWFIVNLPYFIIWGAIIFGIVMLVRGIVRYNVKKNKIRREEEIKKGIAEGRLLPDGRPIPPMMPIGPNGQPMPPMMPMGPGAMPMPPIGPDGKPIPMTTANGKAVTVANSEKAAPAAKESAAPASKEANAEANAQKKEEVKPEAKTEEVKAEAKTDAAKKDEAPKANA